MQLLSTGLLCDPFHERFVPRVYLPGDNTGDLVRVNLINLKECSGPVCEVCII